MKYFDAFSGIGGFPIGIGDKAECIGFSEFDKYAEKIYKHHFPTHKAYGDITKIDAEKLPDFDLLVGGFPCQAFSIAGKRKGFDDTRGTLFFDLARILRAKQPRLFVFENVKGLLSHDNGKTFSTIIATLTELGYDLQWQVLNSKNHGVPQNRERIFIIGHTRNSPRPEVFPFGEDGAVSVERQRQISPTITARYHKQGQSDPYVVTGGEGTIRQVNNPKHSNERVYAVDGISPTLNTMQGGMRQPFILAERGRYKKDGTTEQKLEPRFDGLTNTLTSVEKDNRVVVFVPEATKKGYAEATVGQSINLSMPGSKTRRGRVSDIAQTLDTGMQQYTLTENARIRRLTPLECERLQGFPEKENYAIVEICSENQKNHVRAVLQNPKSQKFVGIAEKRDSLENVFVENNLNINRLPTGRPAQVDVLISCEESGVEISSQGKLLLGAKGVEKKNWSHPLIKIDDFVQLVVGLSTISERIMLGGKEELHQNDPLLTHQLNGKRLVKLYGNEIMQPVEDVKKDSTTLNELLKFTTLGHSDIENLEQKLKTLYLFVIRAIGGYIPKETLNQDTFMIKIKTRTGYTYGVSNTQRYKVTGNAVTTNVIRDIMEKLLS